MDGLEGSVLITGGTGFLGRGILRRAERENWPAQFTVVGRDEEKMVWCQRKFPAHRYILCDVLDTDRLADLMLGHDIVIHGAALKFIPEGELNAYEVVRNNIDGARSVITAAKDSMTSDVVGISTDKAVAPANIYGMSKAVMERLFAESSTPLTRFTTCRYGNVVGSTGSVVPMMRRQIEAEQPVTITDPLMTRYWMSVGEAVSTVVAGVGAAAGSITIPTPTSSNMHTLAHAVQCAVDPLRHDRDGCRFDCRRSGDDCIGGIEIIGVRPGEKDHEQLVSMHELDRTELVDGYLRVLPPGQHVPANAQGEWDYTSEHATHVGHHQLFSMILDSMTV